MMSVFFTFLFRLLTRFSSCSSSHTPLVGALSLAAPREAARPTQPLVSAAPSPLPPPARVNWEHPRLRGWVRRVQQLRSSSSPPTERTARKAPPGHHLFLRHHAPRRFHTFVRCACGCQTMGNTSVSGGASSSCRAVDAPARGSPPTSLEAALAEIEEEELKKVKRRAPLISKKKKKVNSVSALSRFFCFFFLPPVTRRFPIRHRARTDDDRATTTRAQSFALPRSDTARHVHTRLT